MKHHAVSKIIKVWESCIVLLLKEAVKFFNLMKTANEKKIIPEVNILMLLTE